jgi:hypothetical protein
MKYGTHSSDYLVRARQRLDEGSVESLFYAAFELRCGIEARLQQYEEALVNITKIKRAGWKIPKLAKNLEKVFRTGDRIARVDFCDSATEKVRCSLYYTPVNKNLRAMASQIGNLLHFPKEYRPPESRWWNEARDFLESVYKELLKANRGTLLGVPLLDPVTHKVHLEMELEQGENVENQVNAIGTIGERLLVTVHYLDDLPESQQGAS